MKVHAIQLMIGVFGIPHRMSNLVAPNILVCPILSRVANANISRLGTMTNITFAK